MILKLKVYPDNAMSVMTTFTDNGFNPVMSVEGVHKNVIGYPEYFITVDTDKVMEEVKLEAPRILNE